MGKNMVEKGEGMEPKTEENLNSEDSTIGLSVETFVLSRFITIVGEISLRQLIHLDMFVLTEIKRRNFLKEEQDQKKKDRKKRKKKRSNRKSHSINNTNSDKSQENDIDEEIGLTGAIADDMEADYIRSICDHELINSDTLLSNLKSMIIGVCSNPTKYSDANLRTASGLALAKLMLVSSDCCEQNLQLLFTILEKSTEPAIRANTIIAIGDLTFKFPNLVEPWTPRIYARLHDDSVTVRRNTLTVLTHLILNDQIKVKGQISDIALCLSDEDSKIAGLAKLFFNELAKKGNALYNVLPDIISRLSDPSVDITEERFRSILSHIFGLIQKDKKLETFIEKLCCRIQITNNPRQWRDITFCLSLLPYNEKGVSKLTENFACYADKLHEPKVYEMFLVILENARKAVKVKDVIEELEAKVKECHEKGVDDENVVNKARSAKKKTAKSASKKKIMRSDSENSSESDSDVGNHPAQRGSVAKGGASNPVRRSTRMSVTSRKFLDSSSSDDEDEKSSDEEVLKTIKNEYDDEDEEINSADEEKAIKPKKSDFKTPKNPPPLRKLSRR